MFCNQCGKPVHDQAVVCTSCGCAVTRPKDVEKSPAYHVVLACVVSLLFPIFSIPLAIYFGVRREADAACYTIAAAAVGILAGIMILGM